MKELQTVLVAAQSLSCKQLLKMEESTTVATNASDDLPNPSFLKISIDSPDLDEIRPTFMALAIIMCLIITLGNALVLLLFYQERRSLKIAHKYIISMSVCDLCMGLLSVPTQIFMVDQKISADSEHCPWILAILTAIVQTELMVLVVSSVDRYWAVRFPHHYRLKAKDWVANCIILVSWVIPCSFGLIHILTAQPAMYKRELCFMGHETYNPILISFLLFALMPFNLIVMVVLYILIYREMTKLFSSSGFSSQVFRIIFQQQESQSLKKIGKIKIQEIRTTLLLLITVALHLITFIPETGIGYILHWQSDVKPFLISYLLLSINSVFNPFIYAFNIRNVRAAARRLILRVVYFRQFDDPKIPSLETNTTKSAKSTSDKNSNIDD